MKTASYIFDEFSIRFTEETNNEKIIELLTPLLENWNYKEITGDCWKSVILKCEVLLCQIKNKYFVKNFQNSDFTDEDKELTLILLRFAQRKNFFNKEKYSHYDLKGIAYSFTLSHDFDISIQAFKVVVVNTEDDYLLESNLIEVYIKMANIKELQIRDFTISSKFETGNIEGMIKFYNNTDKPILLTDFYLGNLKKDVFYAMKRVYAFLLFKSFIKNNSINQKRVKQFCEKMILEIKNYKKENEEKEIVDNQLVNELRFCLDNLILFLCSFWFDKQKIFGFLDVKTGAEYCTKAMKYKKDTVFEEILSLKILEEFIKEQLKFNFFVNTGNLDFDFVYMSLILDILIGNFNKIKFENVEYLNAMKNLEKYTENQDKNNIALIFKIVDKLKEINSVETQDDYILNVCKLINSNDLELSSYCVDLCLSYMESNSGEILNACKKVLAPEFYKAPMFGSICKLFAEYLKNRKLISCPNLEDKFFDFLSHIFNIDSENPRLVKDTFVDEDEENTLFTNLINSDERLLKISFNCSIAYLNNMKNRLREYTENEIIYDIGFFRLFKFRADMEKLHSNLLHENLEFIFECFDNIIQNMPNIESWITAFFDYTRHLFLFHTSQLELFHFTYFLQKIVSMLPEINDIKTEDMGKKYDQLVILEKYLFVICGMAEFAGDMIFDSQYEKSFNIVLNIVMNLLPKFYKYRSSDLFQKNFDFVQIRLNHISINGSQSKLLDSIFNELMYFVAFLASTGALGDEKLLDMLFEHIYSKTNKPFFELNFELEIDSKMKPSEYLTNMANWKPDIQKIELPEKDKKEISRILFDVVKNNLYLGRHYVKKNLYVWITRNCILEDDIDLWTKDEIYDWLHKCEYKSDNSKDKPQLITEEMVESLIHLRNGKRGMHFINGLFSSLSSYSKELNIKILDFYLNYFDLTEKVEYAPLFRNFNTINKLISIRNFKSFIQNKPLLISIYLVNNIFCDSEDYLELYRFVIQTLTFKKISAPKTRLDKIFLDPKLRNKDQHIFLEMKINLKVLPDYLKRILKSKKIKLMDKINCCIDILKYLYSARVIMKKEFYLSILKFALKNTGEAEVNLIIKVLIHQLLENPYDVKTKRALYDEHLENYKEFLDFYKVIAFTNINAVRDRLEEKIYKKEETYNKYKYIIKKMQKLIFRALMKKDVNCLNMLTEIMINNPRYCKYITEKFLNTIIDKYLMAETLKDKIQNDSDFEVSVVFLITCLKSNCKKLQNLTITLVKKILKKCSGDKIYNLIILLFRSLHVYELVSHSKEVILMSKDIFELSGKYIFSGIMEIILERLPKLSAEDLEIKSKLENTIFRGIIIENMDDPPEWNNFDTKLTYIYDFISIVLINNFVNQNHEYDSREELRYKMSDYCFYCGSGSTYFPYKTWNKHNKVGDFFSENSSHKRYDCEKKVDIPDYTFKRIYTSYYLYNEAYDHYYYGDSLRSYMNFSHFDKEFFLLLKSIFENRKGKIEVISENVCSWEDLEFINYSDVTENVSNIFNESIGIKHGIRPNIELIELNKLSAQELKKYFEKWNFVRSRLYEDYFKIDIDFLSKCNPLQRKIICKEEEILKSKYLLFGSSSAWPDRKTEEEEKEKYDYNDENISRQYKDYLASKQFNALTEKPYMENIISEIYKLPFNFKKEYPKNADLVLKIHVRKLYKKKVDTNLKIDDFINRDVIINFLESINISDFMYSPNISEFLIIMFKDYKSIVASILEKHLFHICKNSEINQDEIYIIISLIYDIRLEFKEFIEENTEFIRLLIVLLRYKRFSIHIWLILDILNFNLYSLLENNSLLTDNLIRDIHEDTTKRKFLWIYKEFLKHNSENIFLKRNSNDNILNSIIKNFPNDLMDFVEICLKDGNLVLKRAKYVLDLCQILLLNLENEHRVTLQNIKKYHKLKSKFFHSMGYVYLEIKGVFDKNHRIIKIPMKIYDLFQELIQRKDLKPENLIMLIQMYENFISILSITEIKNRNEIIQKYKLIRLQLDMEMAKDKDLYNEIFKNNKKLRLFLINFSFISFTNKTLYFRKQLDKMEDTDNFELQVPRDRILEISCNYFDMVDSSILRFSKIIISFINEKGIDQGGLIKEWFECLAREVSHEDLGLFTYKSNGMIPSEDTTNDNLKYFRFIGRIMGKAIIEQCNFPINLDKTVYKCLLNKKCDLEDIKSFDTQLYNSLVWMRDNPIKDVLHLTFTENTDAVLELKLNGKNIKVTDKNKREYIELIIQKKFSNDQLKALKRGFNECIDEELISIFSEKELELLICGLFEIDINDWKMNTHYDNYKRDDLIIKWFWEVIDELNNEERGKLLHFCTGSSRVPYNGFNNLVHKFTIYKSKGKGLPTTNTCFNRLNLREYRNKEELKKSLMYAINESEGFYGFA